MIFDLVLAGPELERACAAAASSGPGSPNQSSLTIRSSTGSSLAFRRVAVWESEPNATSHCSRFDHEDHNSDDRGGNDYGERVSGGVHVGAFNGVCRGQLHECRARGAR